MQFAGPEINPTIALGFRVWKLAIEKNAHAHSSSQREPRRRLRRFDDNASRISYLLKIWTD